MSKIAKNKNKSPMARRNRNNRKRGAKFEKKVADYLDMYVVPYSGSNARFGYGDIRDVEGTTGGIWLGECKNISPNGNGTLTIQRSWLDDIHTKSEQYGLKAFVAFMQKGRVEKFIILRPQVFKDLMRNNICECRDLILEKKVHNVVNLIISYGELTAINEEGVLCVQNEGDDFAYYVMYLEYFKKLINKNRMHSKYRRR